VGREDRKSRRRGKGRIGGTDEEERERRKMGWGWSTLFLASSTTFCKLV